MFIPLSSTYIQKFSNQHTPFVFFGLFCVFFFITLRKDFAAWSGISHVPPVEPRRSIL